MSHSRVSWERSDSELDTERRLALYPVGPMRGRAKGRSYYKGSYNPIGRGSLAACKRAQNGTPRRMGPVRSGTCAMQSYMDYALGAEWILHLRNRAKVRTEKASPWGPTVALDTQCNGRRVPLGIGWRNQREFRNALEASRALGNCPFCIFGEEDSPWWDHL